MKPREFWLEIENLGRVEMIHRQDPYLLYGHEGTNGGYKNAVHVREVKPIDWDKVWNHFDLTQQGWRDYSVKLQQLVEKQLTGEDK